MSASQSPHLAQIPQAVRIAASPAQAVDPALKTQAIEYLGKVRELSEETWQDCLALYVQGAGAAGPSNPGKDGKQKLETDLRIFCEQVVDVAFTSRSQSISAENQRETYQTLANFVEAEYVEGSSEEGQAFLRNKLASTLAYFFLVSYANIPTFLHPFVSLLSASSSSAHPPILALHLLSEIALEVHDTTMRSARSWSKARQDRDGLIRDAIRTTGDERLAMDGMLAFAERNLASAPERAELAVKVLAQWTPWVDLSVALTEKTLAFYQQLLRHPSVNMRIAAANVIRTFVAKGMQDRQQRIQVLRILGIVALLDPLEQETRAQVEDDEVAAFRATLAGVLAIYGQQLIEFYENNENPDDLRREAEAMCREAMPLLLHFMADPQADVTTAASPFVSDLLRAYKKRYMPTSLKGKMLPPTNPESRPTLEPQHREFLSALLDVLVRQLAWPEGAEWEPPTGEDPDPEDELAVVQAKRFTCRSFIESISQLDRTLHTEVVTRIVGSTLETLQSQGPSALPWQQVELALHLVYTFGEMAKSSTRAAFFELPAEIATRSGRDKQRRISINKAFMDSAMSSGRTTPENGIADDPAAMIPGVYYGGQDKDAIDYEQYPLTPLGKLLALCMSSGVAAYPHPSVNLQYFEIAVRYVDFWRSKPGSVRPIFEAMLDTRGLHQSDATVRRRCFYLFGKLVRECRLEVELDMIPPILESMRDVMVIDAQLPQADYPEQDLLTKATTGKTYFSDQLHLFEAAGMLVYSTKSDPARQIPLLEAVAGPLMAATGSGLQTYSSANEAQPVLQVHHNLLALGHFAKGFPPVSDDQVETLAYQAPFKQMTEALLQALDAMKTQRIVRDAARFAFSQFVSAIGSTVAELVPKFVSHVVTEFEPSELADFMTFLGLLMHRLKKNTFETIDMLLLPLLSRIFAVLQSPVTGTDEEQTHRRLKESYLGFFTSLMNANLDGVFISERNKPEFENLLSALLQQSLDPSDMMAQRSAWVFFGKSVIAWGTSPAAAAGPSVFVDSALSERSKAVANGTAQPTNQHAISKQDRAAQALPGYETFVYSRLFPACFEAPANPDFNIRSAQPVLYDIAMVLRNSLQARGQEAVDYLLTDLLPKLSCPPDIANQLVTSMRSQQSKDFKKTFADFIKAMRS